MTEEKVKEANELLKKLEYLKDQKRRWGGAKAFNRLEVNNYLRHERTGTTLSVDDSFINFDDIKLLALARIDKRIQEVQKEFDEL